MYRSAAVDKWLSGWCAMVRSIRMAEFCIQCLLL
jgi:hypothetical protein